MMMMNIICDGGLGGREAAVVVWCGSPPVIRWSGLEARWGGRGKVEISQKKMEKRGECRKL